MENYDTYRQFTVVHKTSPVCNFGIVTHFGTLTYTSGSFLYIYFLFSLHSGLVTPKVYDLQIFSFS